MLRTTCLWIQGMGYQEKLPLQHITIAALCQWFTVRVWFVVAHCYAEVLKRAEAHASQYFLWALLDFSFAAKCLLYNLQEFKKCNFGTQQVMAF